MEEFGMLKLFEFGIQFGLAGVVLILWFLTDRSKTQLMESYRKDVTDILARYGQDIQEIRHMYESNVRLVKAYEEMAKDLHEVVIINTQTMQRVCEEIRTNQYCPAVRINEKKKGRRE